MKNYRAIKELVIEMVDGDGFTEYEECEDSDGDTWLTTKEGLVSIGSLWESDEDSKWRVVGGEARLTLSDGESDFGWIEITIETLDEYFEEVI